jgi:uncharacterized protein
MKFQIIAEKNSSDKKSFYYDNETNILTDEIGKIYEFDEATRSEFSSKRDFIESIPFSKNLPLTKSKLITTLKIQLGLSCNYSCDYCSQKFVERPPETSKKDIDDFLKKLEVLEFSESNGLNIEFWGGEPLVYWKTIKPLTERLMDKFKHWTKKPRLSVITNGSLLTYEICSWLDEMGFSVSISHDGPNQSVRGPDPLSDPEKRKIILDFYKIMSAKGRFSFNSMMNRRNTSRKEIHKWFVELTGDPNVVIGEGSMIDAYDEDGANNSLSSLSEHFEYRRTSFLDIYASDGNIGFAAILDKVNDFTKDVLFHIDSKFLGQKCGMDDPHKIAVDLKGNIVTCQNVSVKETSKNGESHLAGNLTDYENVKLKSVTHWKLRNNDIKCSECPVLHICSGSCMYLEGEYWDITCENAYSENISIFALSFEKITGYIPTLIQSDNLPLHRQDIWGTIFSHTDLEKRKIIPIKVINKKEMIVNDIEVYSKSIIEGSSQCQI